MFNKDVIGPIPTGPSQTDPRGPLTSNEPPLSLHAARPGPPKLGGPIHKLFSSNWREQARAWTLSVPVSSAGTGSNLIHDRYPHPRVPPLRLRTLPPQKCLKARAEAASGPLRFKGGAWFPLGPRALLLRLRVLALATPEGARPGQEGWVEPQRAPRISLRQSSVTLSQLRPQVFPEQVSRLQLRPDGWGFLRSEGGGRGAVGASGI